MNARCSVAIRCGPRVRSPCPSRRWAPWRPGAWCLAPGFVRATGSMCRAPSGTRRSGCNCGSPRAGQGAGLGSTSLDPTSRAYLLDRYLHPHPRLALRNALLTHASGGMDVSDGLVGDLRKMMRASGCSAEVDLARVPVSEAARQALVLAPDLFDLAVNGGRRLRNPGVGPARSGRSFRARRPCRGCAGRGDRYGCARNGTAQVPRHGRPRQELRARLLQPLLSSSALGATNEPGTPVGSPR